MIETEYQSPGKLKVPGGCLLVYHCAILKLFNEGHEGDNV